MDRTQPLLPMTFDKQEKRTHDYVRHGTTTLFAALDMGTGEVTASCHRQHRAVEFLSFLDTVEDKYRDRETHVVLDNFSTHSTAAVKEWLAEHPNFHFHFTPVSGPFMNQVETWFGVITKQAIRRGTFKSWSKGLSVSVGAWGGVAYRVGADPAAGRAGDRGAVEVVGPARLLAGP